MRQTLAFVLPLLLLSLSARAQQPDIRWNDAPPNIHIEPDPTTIPNIVVTPAPAAGNTAPPQNTAAEQASVGPTKRRSIIVDDAPPPRAAPRRKDVNVLSLAAPFGIIENSVAPPRPRYAPALSPKGTPKVAVKPSPKPQAPADANFTVRFGRLRIEVSDSLTRWQNASLPVSLGPNLALVMQAAALSAKENPTARLEILAYASQGGWQSEARRHSMARALAVYEWLVGQGVRPTQIDWRAMGQANDTDEPERVDILLRTQATP